MSLRRPDVRVMPVTLRPMEERHVTQCEEIERDAFPTLFPKTSFRGELRRRMASYLVACERADPDPVDRNGGAVPETSLTTANGGAAPEAPLPTANGGLLGRLAAAAGRLRGGLSRDHRTPLLLGFLGLWYMPDDAHVVSVGVRTPHRGRGVGELLLLGALEQATLRNARAVTLEVRVSNHPAISLYAKYGFNERGIRKGYYSDNREDAIIMTTGPIQIPAYQQTLARLIEAHERRWGRSERLLPRHWAAGQGPADGFGDLGTAVRPAPGLGPFGRRGGV